MPTTPQAPAATLHGVSAALRVLARPAGTFDAARYFHGDHRLRFYNVGTDRMRALAKATVDAHRDVWSIDDAMALGGSLMRDPYLETKSVGIEVVARFRREFTPRLLPRWKRWLAQDCSANWATTDAVCGALIGPLLAECPALLPAMRVWVRHRNLWVRRASIVSLIVPMRRGLALDLAYEQARALHPDPNDLIQKAVGWVLRETGKRDAARLDAYLRANGASIPRTTVRYAIERFPPAVRRELLAVTRSR
jgi:3-methyladenine DNA glycosylase AlkD